MLNAKKEGEKKIIGK